MTLTMIDVTGLNQSKSQFNPDLKPHHPKFDRLGVRTQRGVPPFAGVQDQPALKPEKFLSKIEVLIQDLDLVIKSNKGIPFIVLTLESHWKKQ